MSFALSLSKENNWLYFLSVYQSRNNQFGMLGENLKCFFFVKGQLHEKVTIYKLMDQIILDEFCYVSILYQKGFMECNVRNDVTNRSCRQYLNKFTYRNPSELILLYQSVYWKELIQEIP